MYLNKNKIKFVWEAAHCCKKTRDGLAPTLAAKF